MAERTPNGGTGADVLDRVRWDYDPEGEQLSPLVSTERYFRDFPWEPEELVETIGGENGRRSGEIE